MALLEPGLIKTVGFTALGLLVAGWAVSSFMPEGRARTILEWATATCMYLALLSLFLNLVRHALEDDSILRLIVFGPLALLFASGAVVCFFRTFGSMAGSGRHHVTN